MLEFGLPSNDIPLSNIFENLQKAQENLHLQDFSVSQTTLDQVCDKLLIVCAIFLKFKSI
jgi:enolase